MPVQKIYQGLIQKLGWKGGFPQFELGNLITPVVILEDESKTPPLQAQLFTAWVTQGNQVAAPANTIHANTDALQAGVYRGWIWLAHQSAADQDFRIDHQDATGAIRVSWQFLVNAITRIQLIPFTVLMQAQEGMRVLNLTAMPVGANSQVVIVIERQ